MRKTKLIKRNFILFLTTFVVTGGLFSGSAAAADQNSGKLTVTVEVTDDSTHKTTGINGAEISIVKIASLDSESSKYTLDSEFSSVKAEYRKETGHTEGDLFETMTKVSDSNMLASLISEMKPEADSKGTTNSNGSVSFSNLEDGMYLVSETGKTGAASDYTEFSPYLVSVPQYENDAWNYDVKVYPKTGIEKSTTPPSIPPSTPPTTPPSNPPQDKKSPKTGEIVAALNIGCLAIVFSVMGITTVIGRKKRRGGIDE